MNGKREEYAVKHTLFAAVALSSMMGLFPPILRANAQARTPIILDADIGSDIDDAYALAMLIESKQVNLLAVTTVSGDTQARARIAAKMLLQGGMRSVPVAAGVPDDKPPFPQGRWAEGFTSPSLVADDAVSLMKRELDKGHGKVVIIAIGPLTNLATLLKRFPEERKNIAQIALMGGSVEHGYYPGSGPTPEYNIAADASAAQAVFASGIPIIMAPLDVTARLQMDEAERNAFFARHTPETEAVHSLYVLWGQPTPTLHDPMAVAMLLNPGICQTKRLDIQIDDKGVTRAVPNGPANALVGVAADPARFMTYYEEFFAAGK